MEDGNRNGRLGVKKQKKKGKKHGKKVKRNFDCNADVRWRPGMQKIKTERKNNWTAQ